MKRQLFAGLLILACIYALPISTLANTQDFTPPAEKGTVYVIVHFDAGYGIVGQNTNVSIRWGNWSKSGSFHPGYGRTPKQGVVISLRHSKNDSVTMTVRSNGTIEDIYQGSAPSRNNYQYVSW